MTETAAVERWTERDKAIVLFERLTVSGIPCKLDARRVVPLNSDDEARMVFTVNITETGTSVDEAMEHAHPNDFRCIMGGYGIEFHVIPEEKPE